MRSGRGLFPRGDFGLGLRLDQVLRQPAEEELQFLLRHRGRERVAQIVLVGVVLGRVVATPVALSCSCWSDWIGNSSVVS